MSNTVYPSLNYPQLPILGPTRYRRPISGATVSGFASQVMHYRGVRCRRAAHKQWCYTTDPNGVGVGGFASAGNVVYQDPEGVSRTYRVWWASGVDVEHVIVTFQYQASTVTLSASSKQDIKVVATLYKKGAGIIDAPDAASAACRWSIKDGTLGLRAEDGGTTGSGENVVLWPLLDATTGDRPRSPAAPYPNGPRPLVVPSANRGDDLELRLETTYCRIVAVDVWELAEESVTV